MHNRSVSVIIPAYNESARIVPTIEAIELYMKSSPRSDYEIIVVDDGSTDGTAQTVMSLMYPSVRVLFNPSNMGKGAAVRNGILNSSKEFALVTDADMSTPIGDIDKLMGYIDAGYDIVIGSRALADSDVKIKQPWHRQTMGKVFNLFVRSILMGDFKDTQCGFKLFKGDAARRVFRLSRINGFSFDAEVLFLAGRLGYKIKEAPVTWLNSPDSRVSIASAPAKMLMELFKIRIDWSKGLYKE